MDPLRPLDILTVGHSYCVALNRRLCREVARAGGDRVSVTVAAPSFYRGDLRPIPLEPLAGEPYALEPVPTYASRLPHVFLYGRRLGALLARPWDVVHAWEEPYILAGGQVAAWTSRRSSLVFSSFQNQPKRFPPPFAQVERFALARSSGWTAFGHTVAANLAGRPGYRDRPHATIPLGVDLDAFRPDPAARRATLAALDFAEIGPPVVGYLGRFVPEKGLGVLMNSLDALPPNSWRALFVGGGPMEADLRAWSARHPGRARVVTGVPHAGVPAFLNAFDILAAPSLTTPRWREQLGRMLLEAMAAGVPVVASDSGEIPHVVADAGLLLPEGDGPSWISGLGRLVDSPSLRDDLRARGLDRARSVYAWPRVAAEFLAFFRTVREAGPPRD